MVLLDDLMTIDKVAFRERKALGFHDPRQKRLDCVEGQMWNFFSETAIAQGYNFREGQYDMAEGVLEAISPSPTLCHLFYTMSKCMLQSL